MMLIVLTSLPAADCSTFLLLRREKLDHQWFEAWSVVQPVPMSTMNVGIVGLRVQQPVVVGRLPSRSARVRGSIGVKFLIATFKSRRNWCLPDSPKPDSPILGLGFRVRVRG